METERLVACPACGRHHAADESSCPFCGHERGATPPTPDSAADPDIPVAVYGGPPDDGLDAVPPPGPDIPMALYGGPPDHLLDGSPGPTAPEPPGPPDPGRAVPPIVLPLAVGAAVVVGLLIWWLR